MTNNPAKRKHSCGLATAWGNGRSALKPRRRASTSAVAGTLQLPREWQAALGACRTLEEARRAKASRLTDIHRGDSEERSRLTLREPS